MAASVSYLARRIVAEIDEYVELGRDALEQSHDLRITDRLRGRLDAFREIRKVVLEEDRKADLDEDDDQEQPRSLNTLVADEDAG